MTDEKTQKPGLGRRKSSLNTLRDLSQRLKSVGRKASESVEEEREIIGGKHVPFGAVLAFACSFKMQGPLFCSSLISHTQMVNCQRPLT
jgi:hypothetical protein